MRLTKVQRKKGISRYHYFASTPQFHTYLLSSTNRFHTRTKPFHHPKSLSFIPKPLSSTLPSVPHQKPPVQDQNPVSSSSKIPQFHTKNPSVQLTPHFHTKNPQWNTENTSVPHTLWFGTEGCVELMGFRFWTEGFFVWNGGVFGVELRGVLDWGVFAVELRDFRGWKGVTLL